MVRFPLRLVLPAAVFFVLVSLGRADLTLLSNLPSNNGGQGLVSSGTQRAVSFTMPDSAFYVGTVTMRLIDYVSSTDTALLTFRLDDNGAPSSTVYASLDAPVSASNTAGDFVFTTTGITLNANTMYWLVIAAASDAETFSWVRSNPVETPTGLATFGTQEISSNGGATWSTGSSGPHSFAINGVPEPTVVILSGLGLAAVLIFRRRSGRIG